MLEKRPLDLNVHAYIYTTHSSTLITLIDVKKMDLPPLDGSVLVTAEQTISLAMAFEQICRL